MATQYEPAPPQAVRMLDEIRAEWRPDLADATICLLFATSDKEGVPALRSKGQPLAGRCKINGYEDRVQGKADATITVDGDDWGRWSTNRQRALLHHELTHIARWDGQKRDAHDRPAIHSRPGDWNFDGFAEIRQLYGDDSFEQFNLNAVEELCRQETLPFGEGDDEPRDESETSAA